MHAPLSLPLPLHFCLPLFLVFHPLLTLSLSLSQTINTHSDCHTGHMVIQMRFLDFLGRNLKDSNFDSLLIYYRLWLQLNSYFSLSFLFPSSSFCLSFFLSAFCFEGLVIVLSLHNTPLTDYLSFPLSLIFSLSFWLSLSLFIFLSLFSSLHLHELVELYKIT